jgi:hypothetical protein
VQATRGQESSGRLSGCLVCNHCLIYLPRFGLRGREAVVFGLAGLTLAPLTLPLAEDERRRRGFGAVFSTAHLEPDGLRTMRVTRGDEGAMEEELRDDAKVDLLSQKKCCPRAASRVATLAVARAATLHTLAAVNKGALGSRRPAADLAASHAGAVGLAGGSRTPGVRAAAADDTAPVGGRTTLGRGTTPAGNTTLVGRR